MIENATSRPIRRLVRYLNSAWIARRWNGNQRRGRSALHFLHIGKTGGTAVKHALNEYLETDRYLIYLHYHGFRLTDVPAGEGAIFFLRDPVTRFVSGFSSRQRQGRPKHFTPWSMDERQAFENFHTPAQLASALSSDDASKRARAERAMRHIQHISNSYCEWLKSEQYLLSRQQDIFFVGFQESLAEDFEVLKAKLELPTNLQLPDDDVLAHKSPEHPDWVLPKEARDNLTSWYRQDYAFIARCREIRRTI